MAEELKPCPFCGCSMRLESNRDWHRIVGDHALECVFTDSETMVVPATKEQRDIAVSDWNIRSIPAGHVVVSEGLVQGMAKFAQEIICGALDGGSFDGADIQESAERHRLIAKQVMNESCRGPEEYCACAWSTSFPAECYRVTPELRALLSEQA
ncbi:Lar family restriction alleviation protein [Pseudomonas aeruginosa]|uniref:Lar family restriction alleviation protein n=1 Tax=Pseudomonas aeruginosa TaxID=287 RepID=UPI0021BBD871|nr:Lar family restriction alleviation protein [Pseudomonas aeruginosa]